MQPFQWASRSMKMMSFAMRRMPPATLKNRVNEGNSYTGEGGVGKQAHQLMVPPPQNPDREWC